MFNTPQSKLLLNTLIGILKQVTVVICGFILPRYILEYYGSSVNGLITSINYFLGLIAFADMGVGAVVQSNLYKYLVNEDDNKLNQVIQSSKNFFKKVSYIFLGYTIILCFILPFTNNTLFDNFFTISLIIIIASNLFVQFLFGITYQILLNADQRSYIQLSFQIFTVLLSTILAVFFIKSGSTIHFVKLIITLVYIFRTLLLMAYVHKFYSIRKTKIEGEYIKQKWNGFSQHLSSVISQNIDVIVLSFFSTLDKVSIYSIYYNVVNGISLLIISASNGLESFFGNIMVKDDEQKLLKYFAIIEWIIHFIVSIFFTITLITVIPFITIYTFGITDADYINNEVFCKLLIISYTFLCIRIPYFRIIKAAGHFKETQNGAFIAAIINVIITIILVKKFNLVGAASGTLIAMIFHTCYLVYYLQNNILHRQIIFFVKYIISDVLIFVLSVLITQNMVLYKLSYIYWVVFAIKITIVVLFVAFFINFLFYRKFIVTAYNYFQKVFLHRGEK